MRRADIEARARLSATLDAFIEAAAAQGREVEEMARRLEAAPEPEAAREDGHRLQALAHRLAGSAGSLGFTALGRTAAALERTLMVAAEISATLAQDARDDLQEQIVFLARAVGAQARSLDGEKVRMKEALPRRAVPLAGAGEVPLAVLTVGVEDAVEDALVEAGFFPLPRRDAAPDGDSLPPLAGVIVDMGTAPDRDLQEWLAGVRAAGIPLVAVGGAGTFLWRVRAYRMGAAAYLPHADAAEAVERLLRLMVEGDPLRVLLVSDDPLDVGLVGGPLEEAGVQVEVLARPEDVLSRLDVFEPDVLVVRLGMRTYAGAEVAAVVRGVMPLGMMPVLGLARPREVGAQVEAVRAGVEAVLTTPLHPEIVVAMVRERGRQGREARERLRRDPPTGLLTQEAMQEFLQREVSRARRGGTPVAVALFDPDHLRSIVTAHGQRVGEEVVRLLAQTLRRRLRGSDAAGRCCGTAVAAILPGATVGQAAAVIGSLVEEIQGASVQTPDGPVVFTVSVGIASVEEGSALEDVASAAQGVMARVEQALGQARALGGGQVVVVS